jgi:hypothetical protein
LWLKMPLKDDWLRTLNGLADALNLVEWSTGEGPFLELDTSRPSRN